MLQLGTEKYKTSFLKNMSNAQRRILWGKLAFALEMCIAESFKLSDLTAFQRETVHHRSHTYFESIEVEAWLVRLVMNYKGRTIKVKDEEEKKRRQLLKE